jgi:hypothetical protein
MLVSDTSEHAVVGNEEVNPSWGDSHSQKVIL